MGVPGSRGAALVSAWHLRVKGKSGSDCDFLLGNRSLTPISRMYGEIKQSEYPVSRRTL